MKERGGCSERVVISSQSRKSSKKEQATAPTKHHDEGHQHEFSFDSSNHTHTQKRKNPLVIPNTMQMIKKKTQHHAREETTNKKGKARGGHIRTAPVTTYKEHHTPGKRKKEKEISDVE
jgi:hypothetical protein